MTYAKSSRRRRVGSGVCALAMGLAAVGCGSSSSGSKSPTSSTPAAAAATATQSAPQSTATTTSGGSSSLQAAADLYGKFTGGKVGKATGSPIVIGFMNDQGGVPSFPENTAAAQVAAQFINAQLDGIGGRPIKLSQCLVTTESEGQGCAEQFVSAHVPIVVEGAGNTGGATFHQTLAAKIPVVESDPATGADAAAKNSYGVSAAVFASDPGFLAYAKQLHAKTASLLFPGDDPAGQVAAKGIETEFKAAGIKVIPSGYTSTSPDLLPDVEASQASSTDLTLALFVSPSECIAGAKALKQANVTKPIVSLQTCIAPPVKAQLGDFPQWTYISDATNPLDPSDAATKDYLKAMATYAPTGNVGGQAQEAFVSVLFAARALNHAGGAKASGSAIASQLRGFAGPMPMLAPKATYGQVPGLPALPSLQVRLYTYRGSGQWADATHGKWIGPQK